MSDLFQIPIGPWPFPAGTRVRSRSRPWWGEGEVVASLNGRFAVRWRDPLGTYLWHYCPVGIVELDLFAIEETER